MLRELLDSTGVAISGQSITANFTSEIVDISPWDRWGIIVECGTVSGTLPTLDLAIQTSIENTPVWLDAYPTDSSSGSQAALTQMTLTGDDRFEMWDRFLPQWESGAVESTPAGTSYKQRVRVSATIGGSSTPTFALTKVYIVGIRYRL